MFNTAPYATIQISTPIGSMLAGATVRGICFLEFVDDNPPEARYRQTENVLDAPGVPEMHAYLESLESQLSAYFAGSRMTFELPLALNGTPFQRSVWQGLMMIPYGATCSYQEQAERLGAPKAVRAVARANGANRIAIVIPCHRVIGKNGKLTGYGGGLWRKEYLLKHELTHKPS